MVLVYAKISEARKELTDGGRLGEVHVDGYYKHDHVWMCGDVLLILSDDPDHQQYTRH
jgi:hypothetical protein